jgi:16S rRNA (guanine1516-N2)-methyltransferase
MIAPFFMADSNHLFVTTASASTPELRERAIEIATELQAPILLRHKEPLPHCFDRMPGTTRAIVVQKNRLLLSHRDGTEFFFHPNLGCLRAANHRRGQNDWLLVAAQLQPGDAVLDCTLGYAGEATLMATQTGDSRRDGKAEHGEVHGIEGIPELGLVVREGLKTVVTENRRVNEAMRRVQVVHLGHHLEYLQQCSTDRYDVVYFDPFFDVAVDKAGNLDDLRFFGDRRSLTAAAIAEARRIARRWVIIKTSKWSQQMAHFGITEIFGSDWSKVIYGRLPPGS